MLLRFAGSDAEYRSLPPAELEELFVRLCGIRCRHGRLVPNVGEWRAGDIVMSATENALHPIPLYQKLLYPTGNHHIWSHVGIYDGTGFIWDANPAVHVQEHAVGDYILSKSVIAVVRLRSLAISPKDLVAILTDMAHLPYDISMHRELLIARLIQAFGLSFMPSLERQKIAAQEVICSTFLERVLRHASGGQVFPNLPIVVPSDYSAAADSFIPVKVFWQHYLRD